MNLRFEFGSPEVGEGDGEEARVAYRACLGVWAGLWGWGQVSPGDRHLEAAPQNPGLIRKAEISFPEPGSLVPPKI